MPIMHRVRTDSAGERSTHIAPARRVLTPSGQTRPAAPRPVSPARTSVAWVRVWAAAIALIAVIVFILQNPRSVQVSFLGMHGALPLAVGLLIAMVGGIVVTLVLGTARITQVRRLARRRRRSICAPARVHL